MGRVLIIAGATATGKSVLAVELAEQLGGEVINADALQVYRGFDIGTAKPIADDRRRVAHHLLDVLEPHERFSAGEFARRAREVIGELERRGRLPIVVGGSGLYLRALTEGISPIPPIDPAVRRELRQRLESEGSGALRAELERQDPETAARLAPADRQRLLRALEVVRATGRPLSSWIAERPFGGRRLESIGVGLTLPRALLYDRLSARVGRMLEQGWVEEVRRLLARGLSPSLPAFQAIGYRELAGHLAGEATLAEATEKIIRATRRYAKRQLTWFRRVPGIEWFQATDLDWRPVIAYLERTGLRR